MVAAKVVGFDTEAKRVTLSIKRLTADPFTQVAERFPVEKQVEGTVAKIVKGNIFVDLGESVEGVIPKEKVPQKLK